MRYIYNNPVKAFIVEKPSDYKWISYNIYINKVDDEDEIISTEFILSIFSENKSIAIKEFRKFSPLDCDKVFVDLEEDMEKVQIEKIEQILGRYKLALEDLSELKDRKIRTKIIKEINDSVNLSTRQMSKIIGLSKDIIAKALRDS